MEKIVLKEEAIVNLERLDICCIERQIKTKTQEISKRLLKQALIILEEKARQKTSRCSCGKNKWENRGRVGRTIKSIVGEVKYKRVKMRCISCGKYRYPLDEMLVLDEYRNMTLGLVEESLYLATDTAYDKAADNLEKLTGIKISGRQIQNIAKEEGNRVIEHIAEERQKIFEETIIPESNETRNRVIVQMDGIFVKNRDKEESRSRECKVGIIYSKKVKVSKKRNKILDKRTYATTKGAQVFREEFIAECNRWGVWDAKEILFIGDGANWIKKIYSDDFPDAVYLLDFWHLAGHIRKALGEDHERAADNWIEDIRSTYDVKLLLARIQALYS